MSHRSAYEAFQKKFGQQTLEAPWFEVFATCDCLDWSCRHYFTLFGSCKQGLAQMSRAHSLSKALSLLLSPLRSLQDQS